MSQSTSSLSLPLLAAGQAQKHVTHNEALVLIDYLTHLSVLNTTLTSPPATPAQGDKHLVALAPVGAWIGQAGKIAVWEDGGWRFLQPVSGWQLWVQSEQRSLVHNGVDWRDLKVRAADQLGINTTADTTNRLSVSSSAVLFNHAGAGSQLKLNKALATDTTSLLMQTGFSGRAEMGLTGDDDFKIKTSSDGSLWRDSVVINRLTGDIRFPQGMIDAQTGQRPVSLLPCPPRDIWRSDTDAAATPRTYIITSVSGSNITITTPQVEQFFNTAMQNASMVRIWNTSKVPAQAAWVTWNNATNQFSVSNAANSVGWLAGETLRIGDPNPTGTNVLQMVAIDISNYLVATFGASFRQRGLKISLSAQGIGGRVLMEHSGTGALNTNLGASSNSDGSRQSSFLDVFTSVQSPISNSNLLFVRESIVAPATALAATRQMRLVGVWV